MADEMVQYFLKVYGQVEFPTASEITPKGKTTFLQVLDLMLLYRGHPDLLMRALSGFVATESRPLAYAGAASILGAASYQSGYDYDRDGLKTATEWLDVARQDIQSCFEIELIQSEIFQMQKDYTRLRKTLDTINTFTPDKDNFHVALHEKSYWKRTNNQSKSSQWHQEAKKRSGNDAQKLYILFGEADDALAAGQYKLAAQLYEQVVAIDRQDPWAWHNMSIAYLDMKDYANAERCNQIALVLMEFGAARHIQEKIRQAKAADKWAWLRRILGNR